MEPSSAFFNMPLTAVRHQTMDFSREEEIKTVVRSFKKVCAYHTVDQLPRYCYAMEPTVREQKISSRMAEIVRVQHEACTGCFQFQPPLDGNNKEQECIKELMVSVMRKGAYNSDLNACVENHERKTHPLILPDDCMKKRPSGIDGVNVIALLTPQKLAQGDRLGIYNIDHSARVFISNKNYSFVDLNPLEGAVFDAVNDPESGVAWSYRAKYCRNQKILVDVNPMLIETSTSYGEVFLPPDAVQDIVGSTRADGFKPPVYYFSGDPKDMIKLRGGIRKHFSNENYAPFSFVIMNDCDCHMVAVRLLCINMSVVVYIHEGLSPVSMEAEASRSFIIHGVQQGLPVALKNNIICLTTPVPEQGKRPFQVDYRSCGTIAADAIMDFEKTSCHQTLDDWLKSMVSRSDVDTWSINQQVSDKVCLKNPAGKRSVDQIKVFSIPIGCMHALLLKHYQGDRSELAPTQLATIVDDYGRNLHAYYELLCQENDGRNFSSDFWTYTYLSYWQDMVDRFQSVSLDLSCGELNSWLKKYHGFQILAHDWNMLKHYNRLLYTEAELKNWHAVQLQDLRAEVTKLADWLNRLMSGKKPLSADKEFILSWCQYINNTIDTEYSDIWKNQSPQAVLNFIGKIIERIKSEGLPPTVCHAVTADILTGDEVCQKKISVIHPGSAVIEPEYAFSEGCIGSVKRPSLPGSHKVRKRLMLDIGYQSEKIKKKKENNNFHSRKSRMKSQAQLKLLISEVSHITDVEQLRRTCNDKAKNRITLDYIGTMLTSDYYASEPVLGKYPVEEITRQIAQTYGSDKTGPRKRGIIQDRELQSFERKVKHRIDEQIRRDSRAFFTRQLLHIKCQHSGVPTNEGGSEMPSASAYESSVS